MESLFFCIAVLLIFCSSYDTKIKTIESKLKKNLRGEKHMSKVLSELINKKCVLISKDYFLFKGYEEIKCTVLDVDDEWIKFTITDKKGIIKTQFLRIEAIQRIKFIEN